MKTTNQYIALAVLALTFAACTQDEDFIPQGDGDAIKISASIGALQTRVSYDAKGYTTFDKGDQIRVKNTLRTSKNIATYTLTDEGWNTADAFVWSSTSLNQFEAWYPVTDGTSFDTFTLPAEQNSSALLGAADWMTIGTKEIEKPSDKTLKLHFLHMLTKVTVNVTSWGSEYDGTDKTIEDVKIYSLATDIVQDREGLIGQIKTASLTPIAPLADGNSYTAIVCPGLYSSDQKFMTFTVNGTDNLTVLAKVSSPIEIEAAKHYTFNLTVGKDAAIISSVEVIPWAKKEIVGGVAEEVFPSIDGTDYASLSALQNAVKEKFSDEDVTSVTLDGNVTDEVHAAVMSAISEVKTEGAVVNGNLVAGSVTYTVNNFSDALTAWTEGTTLTLLGDATYDDGELLIEDKAVILDLNGYTLTLTETSATARINVAANAELTIRDSGENGQIDSYNQSVQGNGILYLESGTLNKQMQVGNTGTFYMTGGKVLGRNFQDQNSMAIRVVSSAIAYISGGTLQGYNALVNDGMTNISGNPTIIGEDSERSGSAIRNTGSLTISGEPVITAAGYGHLYAETPFTLNIQPTEGTWKVFMWSSDIEPNNGVFAIPGADINLDASKFESLVEGYEVKKLDDGSLALVATATTE